ncbi:MAG: hypothetical protein H0X29_09060 [Parachlamydiaceae bacterium]|nr:hypothetical protein [Parachlamydiaceae bacterium]
MNWVMDPTIDVEPWQVEDYRSLPIDEIFERLDDKSIHLDKMTFIAFADNVDSPEDLADGLLEDSKEDVASHDQVYLMIFELWRRLLPEKPSLSIFCDELDQQIHLCDSGQVKNIEPIQDALANLQVILDENYDEGADPIEAFNCIDDGCANNVESFLYDYIAEQIDNGNNSYAIELLDGFSGYMREAKWFDFLRARVLSSTDPIEANKMMQRLITKAVKDPNFEYNLELLSFLVSVGEKETFDRLVKISLPLIQLEEDFQDLVAISADFFHRLDRESVENTLQNILNMREKIPLYKNFDPKDPQLASFVKVIF